MKRILLLASATAALLLAGCGPDCSAFCNKIIACRGSGDLQQCVNGCDAVGGDQMATINCVVDKTCAEIDAGQCQLP